MDPHDRLNDIDRAWHRRPGSARIGVPRCWRQRGTNTSPRLGTAVAAVTRSHASRIAWTTSSGCSPTTPQSQTEVPLAVCALGGYGRRALCLHSDLDILIVFDGTIGAAEEAFIKAVFQPLWDLRLSLGQHVRELSDLEIADLSNPGVPARPARRTPDHRRRRCLRAGARTCARSSGALVIDRSVAGTGTAAARAVQRHALPARAGHQAGAWRPAGCSPCAGIFACCNQRQRSTRSRRRGWSRPKTTCCRIRSILHLEGGRDVNVLTHELQEGVAEMMGSAGSHAHRRVEALMGDYFRSARVIARALAQTQLAIRPPKADGTARRVGRQFEVAADGVRFIDLERAASQPSLWLEAFRIAIERGTRSLGPGAHLHRTERAPVFAGRLRRDRGRAPSAAPGAATRTKGCMRGSPRCTTAGC